MLVRRLTPGKTYDDFVDAWYPEKGFGFPGRGPILARNLEDDREILAIGFIDLERDQLPATMGRIAAQESVRHDRIDERSKMSSTSRPTRPCPEAGPARRGKFGVGQGPATEGRGWER